MKILLGGIIALIIGGLVLIGWWGDFLTLIKGAIPIIFVVGGALTAYLGIDGIKTKSATPASEGKK